MRSDLSKLKVLLLLTAAIVINIPAISQSDDCAASHQRALDEYKANRYKEALSEFRKTDGCKLTKYQYYNGGFIAALNGEKKLAFYYLQKAVDLGYDNLDHMSKDSDLNSIRNEPEYARIVHSIETKHEEINRYFGKSFTVNENLVELVRRRRGSNEMFGIATDSTHLKGIINAAGDTLKGFGFRYAEIHAIIDVFGYPRFLAKKRGQNFFQFYSEGKVMYSHAFTDYESLTKYQNVRGDQMHYAGAGSEGTIAIKVGTKWYIVYVSNGKKITDKGYDDVRTLNGPGYERDPYGELRRGSLADYFLVKEGSDLFYIDLNGKEYKAK